MIRRNSTAGIGLLRRATTRPTEYSETSASQPGVGTLSPASQPNRLAKGISVPVACFSNSARESNERVSPLARMLAVCAVQFNSATVVPKGENNNSPPVCALPVNSKLAENDCGCGCAPDSPWASVPPDATRSAKRPRQSAVSVSFWRNPKSRPVALVGCAQPAINSIATKNTVKMTCRCPRAACRITASHAGALAFPAESRCRHSRRHLRARWP